MARFRAVADKVRRASAPADGAPGEGPNLQVTLGVTSEPPGPGWTSVALDRLGPEHTQDWAKVEIRSGSLAELRRAVPWLALAGSTQRLRIVVARTDRQRALQPPALVGNRAVTVATLGRSPHRLDIELSRPTEVATIVRACLAPVETIGRRHGGAGLRLALTEPSALSWSVGAAHVPVLSQIDSSDPVQIPDLLLGPDIAGVPPVDTAFCSPLGFRPSNAGLAELTADASGLYLAAPGGVDWTLDPLVGLTENHIRALRGITAVRYTDAGTAPGVARVLSQLCCAGVPTCAPALPSDFDLGGEITGRLRRLTPEHLSDPVTRESWSVTTRRMALARFSPDAYWRSNHGHAPPPTVSVLLATRRPELLAFALAQVERQDWPALEIVLVLHGVRGDEPAVQAAIEATTRPLTVVEVEPDVVFGRALGSGLARCAGRLVTKMDDDDWYGRHHVTDLVQAHAHSGATLVGSSGYHLYLADADVTLRWTKNPTETAATWVHGGTMLLARDDLHALGAWPPVALGEDAHVIRAVRASGGWIYGIHDLGFLYYRGQGHTWMPATGSAFWLDAEVPRTAGFAPPPQLDPLPHPWMAQ